MKNLFNLTALLLSFFFAFQNASAQTQVNPQTEMISESTLETVAMPKTEVNLKLTVQDIDLKLNPATQQYELKTDALTQNYVARFLEDNKGKTATVTFQGAPKDPDLALVISLLIPGGGHLYSGETKKGVILLGTAIAAPWLGIAVASAGCAITGGRCIGITGLAGLLAGVGAYIYGIIDAKPSVQRMNGGRRYSVAPQVMPNGRGGATVGMGFQYSFRSR